MYIFPMALLLQSDRTAFSMNAIYISICSVPDVAETKGTILFTSCHTPKTSSACVLGTAIARIRYRRQEWSAYDIGVSDGDGAGVSTAAA